MQNNIILNEISKQNSKIEKISIDKINSNIKPIINLIIKVISLIEKYNNNLDNNSKLNIAVNVLTQLIQFGILLNLIKNPLLKILVSVVVQLFNHFEPNWKIEIAQKETIEYVELV